MTFSKRNGNRAIGVVVGALVLLVGLALGFQQLGDSRYPTRDEIRKEYVTTEQLYTIQENLSAQLNRIEERQKRMEDMIWFMAGFSAPSKP